MTEDGPDWHAKGFPIKITEGPGQDRYMTVAGADIVAFGSGALAITPGAGTNLLVSQIRLKSNKSLIQEFYITINAVILYRATFDIAATLDFVGASELKIPNGATFIFTLENNSDEAVTMHLSLTGMIEDA